MNPANRRDFLRVGSLAAFGTGLGTLAVPALGAGNAARKKHGILIWLDGGPSHLETFDLKPNAPAEVRGPLAAIPTRTPGIQISECMPELAKRMDDVAIVRSVTSPLGEHNFGAHYLLTGYRPSPVIEHPTYGSVLAHLSEDKHILPPHIAAPRFRVGGANFSGNGYLPAATRPYSVMGDPAKPDFQVSDLDYYPGLNDERVQRRRDFVKALESLDAEMQSEPAVDPALDQALQMILSPTARQAFDLSQESEATRNRYGRKTIGQCCLLARRLVERGVPFVTVNNTGWDTHKDAYTRLKEGFTGATRPVGLIPSLDLAMSALIDDLRSSGLLEDTLIIVMGEFGRTPKLNTSGGRDHWPRVFSVAFAGGGVKGGQVVGASDAVGESPKDRPIKPEDLAATIYRILGVDPRHMLETADGRPIQISRDGELISELLS